MDGGRSGTPDLCLSCKNRHNLDLQGGTFPLFLTCKSDYRSKFLAPETKGSDPSFGKSVRGGPTSTYPWNFLGRGTRVQVHRALDSVGATLSSYTLSTSTQNCVIVWSRHHTRGGTLTLSSESGRSSDVFSFRRGCPGCHHERKEVGGQKGEVGSRGLSTSSPAPLPAGKGFNVSSRTSVLYGGRSGGSQ